MDPDIGISRVAIVGTGLIGSSWAACFLAHGLDVIATDPAPGAEDNARQYIDAAWPALAKIGLAPGASTSRLEFTGDLKGAVASADLVQENAPEREPIKIKLFAEMDSILPPPAILASSTSGIPMSRIQSECEHPERCVTGHPFNPPHLIPLVEVVGGGKTSAETIRQAMSFYASIGKKPIHVQKEVVGHVANRLQAAIYREIVNLIEKGVLDVADADTAVCWGPGLRWAVMGPNLLSHLVGGGGGTQHFMEHLSGPVAAWWKDLGTQTEFTPQVKQTIVDGVLQEAAGRSIDELAAERDEVLMGLLALRTKPAEAAKPTGKAVRAR